MSRNNFQTSSFWLLLLAMFIAGSQHLSAQAVSFSIPGTNPYCQSAFPNGAPYNGAATCPLNNVITSVKFQLQRQATGGYSFIGGPVTITPPGPAVSVGYNNTVVGFTQLSVTPSAQVRMQAIISYKPSGGGATTTTTVTSSLINFQYFGAPTLDYKLDGLTLSPTVPTVIYGCNSSLNLIPGPGYNVVGTGITWRYDAFLSNSTGSSMSPIGFQNCQNVSGIPANPMNINNPYGNNCVGSQVISSQNNVFILLKVTATNACGSTSWTGLIQYFQQPSGAQVNFGFGGNPATDAQQTGTNTTSGAGEQINGVSNNTDGFLSWGGTSALPTKVGANTFELTSFNYSNLVGSLISQTVSVDDITSIPTINLGSITVIGSLALTGFNLNYDMQWAYPGTTPIYGFWASNNNTPSFFAGRTFRVTVTGNGVCNQNPSKQGFFTIIPKANCANCLQAPNNNDEFIAIGQANTTDNLAIFPNPASGEINITFDVGSDAEVSLLVMNLEGKVIFNEKINANQGHNSITKSLESIPSGTYFAQLVNSAQMLHSKFVKI